MKRRRVKRFEPLPFLTPGLRRIEKRQVKSERDADEGRKEGRKEKLGKQETRDQTEFGNFVPQGCRLHSYADSALEVAARNSLKDHCGDVTCRKWRHGTASYTGAHIGKASQGSDKMPEGLRAISVTARGME